jgi:hypothetical protein
MGVLWRHFHVAIERTAYEACSATWNLDNNTVFALGPSKSTKNLNRFGQSQDIPDAIVLECSHTLNALH